MHRSKKCPTLLQGAVLLTLPRSLHNLHRHGKITGEPSAWPAFLCVPLAAGRAARLHIFFKKKYLEEVEKKMVVAKALKRRGLPDYKPGRHIPAC